MFEPGIHRYRWPNGDTAIGSRSFDRSGMEDNRYYRLRRFNDGNIQYKDQIWDKDNSSWRDLAKYRFNPETLDWTKLDV